MRLLVHVVGEADLLLPSSPTAAHAIRAARIQARCRQLTTAAASPEGATAVRQLLNKGAWDDDYPHTPAPSPLLGALAAVAATPDLDVVLIGTRQQPPHPLDTMPIAQTLTDALVSATSTNTPVRAATAIAVDDLAEAPVVHALARHLDDAPTYQQALVTWGSGATALAMGTLTALSQAGLPWRLVLTTGPTAYETIDPLEQLDTDPVAGVLVRWRMFAALSDLTHTDPPTVRLTDAGRELVREAVDRHDKGFAAHDTASLRAVLADAVVRRDGTASLAVRRYITSRYEELLDLDKINHPWAEDLLRRCEEPRGGPPLGAKLARIAHRHHDDPIICASAALPSYQWLYGAEVNSLQNIGKGSHNLRPPAPCDSKFIGDYLSRYLNDGNAWQQAGLPEPPVAPADTVLAVWLAGVPPQTSTTESVGQQLSRGLPPAVANFLGVQEARLRAVIFGVDDGQGSREVATADAELVTGVTHQITGAPRGAAWTESIHLADVDPHAVEQAIETRLTRETGALLLIPTGNKPVMLALLRAMRLIGARHGIPLFVRENAKPSAGETYTDVHLWPAITGGDLPLLIAAERALRSLELDVAWRLLAASAIGEEPTDRARRLADTFASRQPPRYPRQPNTTHAPPRSTTGMIVQRLELVENALATATAPADRIRLLVVAADAMEASVAATETGQNKGRAYANFRKDLRKKIKEEDRPKAWPALILDLLNEARDRAPITHGTKTTADIVVVDAAENRARNHELSPADSARLPRSLSELLREAVTAAATLRLGKPNQKGSLLRLHAKILEEVRTAISERRAANAADRAETRRAGSTLTPPDQTYPQCRHASSPATY
ncbi:hypothetical protein [Micromonospora rosaria]|uniref:hypothetical protein n=1 Tax=Micromonospora rosaria TaxID=47874 RepID=UPI0012F9B931|nr:hypothetical protein [Micromonospora rosaria]